MGYLENVLDDVTNYVNNDMVQDIPTMIENGDFQDVDDIREYLNDELWCCDQVTGNASGSYTFDREAAKEYVLDDIDTVREALEDFGTSAEDIADHFLKDDWEYFDVTARCYVLGQAIDEYLEENEDAITAKFDEVNA